MRSPRSRGDVVTYVGRHAGGGWVRHPGIGDARHSSPEKRYAGLHTDQAGRIRRRLEAPAAEEFSRFGGDPAAKNAPDPPWRRRRLVGAKATPCGRCRPCRSGWPAWKVAIINAARASGCRTAAGAHQGG